MQGVQPSPYDVWAADEIVNLLQESAIYKPGLKGVFVINRRVSNTAIGRDVIDALRGYPLTIAKAVINQRIAFAESAARGLSVLETAPTGLAGREISALARELLTL